MRSGRLALPYMFGLALLVGAPTVVAIGLAFTEYSGLHAPQWVGLDNFERLVGDEAFYRSLANSLIHICLSVPVRIVATIAAALALHERFKGVGAARAGVYLPSVVPDAAYALLWLWMLNPAYGPLPAILGAAGWNIDFLTDPWSARVSIAVMGVFQIGEGFVIALAARRALPQDVFDAAKVDGASPWFAFRKLTLPLMAPTIALLAIRDVVLALQVNLAPALIVTDGGPRLATTYLPLYAYRQAFRYFRLGYASAIAVSMFLITAVAIYVQYRLARRYKLIRA